MPYTHDLRKIARYDNHVRPSMYPHRAVVQTPARQLLDEFMARQESACHLPLADPSQFISVRVSLRRLIDMYHYPVDLYGDSVNLVIHLSKRRTT